MLINGTHYEKLDKIQNSELYDMFKKMPMPVHHHTHLTGAVDVDFLVRLTYYRYVYYSEKDNKFKVN